MRKDSFNFGDIINFLFSYTLTASLSRAPVNAQQAWDDHVERMKGLERRYPSRYGLYLRDKHAPIVINEEYEPDTKPRK